MSDKITSYIYQQKNFFNAHGMYMFLHKYIDTNLTKYDFEQYLDTHVRNGTILKYVCDKRSPVFIYNYKEYAL